MPKSISLPILAALAALPACTDEPAPSHLRMTLIADLPEPHLAIDYVQSSGKPPHAAVELRYGDYAPVLFDGGLWYCPTVDASLEADLAGLGLAVVDPGSSYSLADSPHCRPPRFEVELPGVAPATTRVSVRDRSFDLAFDLGDVQVLRTFAATGHPDWTFAPDEVVAITVTPPIPSPPTSVSLYASWDEHDLRTTIEGGLQVTVPSAAGPGTFGLVVDSRSRCGSACELDTTYIAKVPATILP